VFKDTKEVQKKDKQHNGQKKKDKRTNNTMVKRKRTKGQTTQWSKEKEQKDSQHNGQKKKNKRTNNDLQNIHIKLKINNTNPTKKTGGECMCTGRVRSSCCTSGTRRVNLVTNAMISIG
jgi:hypothetical protein